MAPELMYPVEVAAEAGLLGTWHQDRPELDIANLPAGVNPGGLDPWSVSTFNIFPNFVILLYERGWYLTYHYWPTSHRTHDWETDYYFPTSRSPRERIQHEVTAAMSKEAGIQDMATLDGTQQGLESRAVDRFPCRIRRSRSATFTRSSTTGSRRTFATMRGFGRDRTAPARGVLESRAVRFRRGGASRPNGSATRSGSRRRCPRCSSSMTRRSRASRTTVDHLEQFPLDDLPEQERNLLYLVYSLITVSLAVDMWGQPEVIDSGNALFFRTVEPIR